MTRASRIARLTLLGLTACATLPVASAPEGDPGPHPARDRIERAPLLVLGVPVHGTTEEPTPYLGAGCIGGGIVGKRSARGYRFVAPRTATYRFAMRAAYPAVLAIEVMRDGPQGFAELACDGRGSFEVLVALRGGETYAAIVDGHMQAQGRFELVVTLDESAPARIRPEDPAIARTLIAAAPRLVPGRTFGRFAAVAAGLRASCGGLGTGTVYAIDVAVPGTLALHASAQFPVAIEVRDRAGSPVTCARGGAERFEVALAPQVAAGSYVVIVDATDLAPDLLDRRQGDVKDRPGSGVRGGFVLDAEVAP